MSIEDKIEDLSVTINNLTSAINVMSDIMIDMIELSQEIHKKETPKKETPKKETPKKETPKKESLITHDDLKKVCIKVNREDNSNHAKIKALIASYDAKKVDDLSEADTQLVHAKLLAGEF